MPQGVGFVKKEKWTCEAVSCNAPEGPALDRCAALLLWLLGA